MKTRRRSRKQKGGLYNGLKQLLGSYALSDARHDFSEVNDSIMRDLPSGDYSVNDDKRILSTIEVFEGDEKSPLDIDTIIEQTNDSNLLMTSFTLKFINSIQHNYNIRIVFFEEVESVPISAEKLEDANP